jgi:putative endonuclease
MTAGRGRRDNSVILSEAKNLSEARNSATSLVGLLCACKCLYPSTAMRSVNTRIYYVYIMASASRVLYIGVTNHIERRVLQHRQRRVPGFSSRYNTRELVYVESFGDVRAAITREKQLKGWLRSKKIALIESLNAQWKDLSADWEIDRAAGTHHTGQRDPSLRSG